MDEMNFSYTNIRGLFDSGLLNVDDLVSQFYRNDLIHKARYVDSVGLPWGSWIKTARIIDAFLLLSGWNYERNEQITFNCNVAYFAPSSFLQTVDGEELIEIVNEFSLHQLYCLFTKEQIAFTLIRLFCNDDTLISKCNLMFCIVFLFSLYAYGVTSKEKEMELCSRIISTHKAQNKNEEIILNLINRRFQSLMKNNLLVNNNFNNKRVALLITGQLRGFEITLPKFIHKFGHMHSIDAYVSTWDNVGIPEFRTLNFYRIFEKDAYDYCVENLPLLEKIGFAKINEGIQNLVRDSYSIELIECKLNSMLSWCENININIEKEDSFGKMSNPQKMYYHNNYWIERMGKDYFSRYDYIIKVRADMNFLDLKPIVFDEILQNGTILTDTDCMCFEWGVGFGDQILIGLTEDMLPLLTCYDQTTLSYIWMMLNEQTPYKAHVNMTIEAWLNNVCLHKNKLKKQSRYRFENKKIKLTQLMSLIGEHTS